MTHRHSPVNSSYSVSFTHTYKIVTNDETTNSHVELAENVPHANLIAQSIVFDMIFISVGRIVKERRPNNRTRNSII